MPASAAATSTCAAHLPNRAATIRRSIVPSDEVLIKLLVGRQQLFDRLLLQRQLRCFGHPFFSRTGLR